MTFTAHGEAFDQPFGAETDLDALLECRTEIAAHRSVWPSVASLIVDAVSATTGLLPDFPAVAGLGGAGSPVPVSGLPTAPDTPNEKRHP